MLALRILAVALLLWIRTDLQAAEQRFVYPPPEAVGPYYTEEIRRTLLARYGEQTLYEGGLRVDPSA